MRIASAVSLGLLALVCARPARAQLVREVRDPESPVTFNIGGGTSIPLLDSAAHFKVGGSFQIGLAYNFSNLLGLQAEYLYSGYDVRDRLVVSNDVEGDHTMQYGTLNAVVNVVPARPVGVYLIGGPGLYHRRVTISEFAGTAIGTHCDPWLFVCFPVAVPIRNVLARRTSYDFGLNAGAGVALRLGGTARLYLESRYHFMFGPTFDTPEGPVKANGQYLPIVFGLRI
ncbi:MAG: porin family protein [Myxococcaceae bacterium]|nr:porin family protein [Myxococcaceae bacterium]MCI0670767.1 porin family protein [Myxococcaceae bacterium]